MSPHSHSPRSPHSPHSPRSLAHSLTRSRSVPRPPPRHTSPGTLDFSEFVQATATYCMFGPEDVRKFCFYIFDKDKNGYDEEESLISLSYV